jgi:hypothetical protein
MHLIVPSDTGVLRFTEPAQDAPVIHAGEEWAYLIWGLGTGDLRHSTISIS